MTDRRYLHTHESDDCCGLRIGVALEKGMLDNTHEWECPKCHCRWTPVIVQNEACVIRHWKPDCPVLVFKAG